MTLIFRPVPLSQEPAASLLGAMRAEIAAMYDDLELEGPDMPKAGPDELGAPGGTFLVGFDAGGRPVCCGGVKRLEDGSCEIKRMYVAPEVRRAPPCGLSAHRQLQRQPRGDVLRREAVDLTRA